MVAGSIDDARHMNICMWARENLAMLDKLYQRHVTRFKHGSRSCHVAERKKKVVFFFKRGSFL